MEEIMTKKSKTYSADFKCRVALEAIKGDLTINEITNKYGVHATQINRWKQQAVAQIKDSFTSQRQNNQKTQEQLTDELYKRIGQQQIELDWLKKRLWN